MLSRFSATGSDAADRRAVSGIEGGGEYGIGRVLSRRPDRVVHATGSAGSIWAIADREPVSIRGERENSGREHALSKLADSPLSGHGDAGNGECGERRKDCWRRPRTGNHSARGWLGRTTDEGSHRRRRFTYRIGLGGAVSGG